MDNTQASHTPSIAATNRRPTELVIETARRWISFDKLGKLRDIIQDPATEINDDDRAWLTALVTEQLYALALLRFELPGQECLTKY
jgi:hypothetical protein